jgi:predicted RNase H-like HicB family nuclease
MIKMNFDMIVFKEGETYVAYCPELDLSSCGNSVPHAKEMLRTAIRLFLEEAEKMGTLEDILSEVHYTVNHDGRYVPPKIIAAEEVSL